jgi:hypothetical protein
MNVDMDRENNDSIKMENDHMTQVIARSRDQLHHIQEQYDNHTAELRELNRATGNNMLTEANLKKFNLDKGVLADGKEVDGFEDFETLTVESEINPLENILDLKIESISYN